MIECLSGLALALLTLVGYSAGAVLAGKGKVTPDLRDVVAVVFLWGMALATRGWLDRWLAIGLWILVGLVAGAGGSALRQSRYPREKTEPTPTAIRGVARVWEAWKAFGLRMGNYQSRVLLALFYFLVALPFGLAVRLLKDPLRTRSRQVESTWTARERSGTDIESARSQF